MKTTTELITYLVGRGFDREAGVRIFLRKHHAHRLTQKGRLWKLAEGTFSLRFPEPLTDKLEYEDGALVLDYVVNEKNFAIALMDDGEEELSSVFGATTLYFALALFAYILL